MSEIVEFPTGRPATPSRRTAQQVFEEMRILSAELAQITGHPVSIQAQGDLDSTTKLQRRP